MMNAEIDEEAPTQVCALRPRQVGGREPVPNHVGQREREGLDRHQPPGVTRERSGDRASTLKVGDIDLVDAKTLAGKLSVGRTTILRFAREGKIPYYAIGRAWFFSEKEVLGSLRRRSIGKNS